jgi:cytochrome c oxidase assembly factor CtaG
MIERILLNWEFEPSIVIGCVLIWGAYLVATRFKLNLKSFSFTLGVLCIFLALTSPIDLLADHYLFSVHMLQHMMIGIIAPPLMIAGLPASIVEAWLRSRVINKVERMLGNPPVALVAGIGTIWFWHLPYFYDLALQNEHVHTFEHIMFIVTGSMLWWPVLNPIAEKRLKPMMAIIYMGIASTLGMILGIIFTLSDTSFYSYYANPEDELEGTLKLIREDWHLTAVDDQKLGGAIMWEPMGCIFLWVIMSALNDWFKHPEHEVVHETTRRQEDVRAK